MDANTNKCPVTNWLHLNDEMYDESNKKIETLKWKLVTNKWNTLIDYTIKPIDVREGTSGTSADVPRFSLRMHLVSSAIG